MELAEDSGSDSSSSASVDSNQAHSRVLDFGWKQLHEAARSRLARESAAVGKPAVKRRPYDNTRRSAGSAYKRVKKSGKFKSNGLSPKRISSVLATDPCGWFSTVLTIRCFWSIQPTCFCCMGLKIQTKSQTWCAIRSQISKVLSSTASPSSTRKMWLCSSENSGPWAKQIRIV